MTLLWCRAEAVLFSVADAFLKIVVTALAFEEHVLSVGRELAPAPGAVVVVDELPDMELAENACIGHAELPRGPQTGKTRASNVPEHGIAASPPAYCRSIAGIVLTFCAQSRAELHQIRLLGGSDARSARHPTRSEYAGGWSVSADECTGAPQSAQNV